MFDQLPDDVSWGCKVPFCTERGVDKASLETHVQKHVDAVEVGTVYIYHQEKLIGGAEVGSPDW